MNKSTKEFDKSVFQKKNDGIDKKKTTMYTYCSLFAIICLSILFQTLLISQINNNYESKHVCCRGRKPGAPFL